MEAGFDFGRAVSRILSAQPFLNVANPEHRPPKHTTLGKGWGENHLSQQPIPGTRPALRDLERATPRSPIWPCTRWGFPCLLAYARSGGLLPHLFTLAPLFVKPKTPLRPAWVSKRAGRFIFCGTVRRGALWHRLPRVSDAKRLEPPRAVTRHRTLRCSDFPPPARAGSDSPPFQNRWNIHRTEAPRQAWNLRG